jgi:hypothetical protein
LDKKCLEGSTGLKNYPQKLKFFLLASTPLSKFLGTPLIRALKEKKFLAATNDTIRIFTSGKTNLG